MLPPAAAAEVVAVECGGAGVSSGVGAAAATESGAGRACGGGGS